MSLVFGRASSSDGVHPATTPNRSINMEHFQQFAGIACAIIGFAFLAFLSVGMIYVAKHEEDLPDDLIK